MMLFGYIRNEAVKRSRQYTLSPVTGCRLQIIIKGSCPSFLSSACICECLENIPIRKVPFGPSAWPIYTGACIKRCGLPQSIPSSGSSTEAHGPPAGKHIQQFPLPHTRNVRSYVSTRLLPCRPGRDHREFVIPIPSRERSGV